MEYETMIHSIMVKPPDEPIFSDLATEITLEDEAAGLFVSIIQRHEDGEQKVSICKEEWPLIRQAVDDLMLVVDEKEVK